MLVLLDGGRAGIGLAVKFCKKVEKWKGILWNIRQECRALCFGSVFETMYSTVQYSIQYERGKWFCVSQCVSCVNNSAISMQDVRVWGIEICDVAGVVLYKA